MQLVMSFNSMETHLEFIPVSVCLCRCKNLTDCAAEEIKSTPFLLLSLLGLIACAAMLECYCIRSTGRMVLP